MILKYISEVRLFEILFEGLDFYNHRVKGILLNYINNYIKYKEFSSYDLKLNYESFLKQYSKDAKFYLKNNAYPALIAGNNYPITREEYDIFLLLSSILTQHRYDIMCEINQSIKESTNALVIGSGIGLEIEIIKDSYKSVDAYDIRLDKFCFSSHEEVNFYETEFQGSAIKKYNDVYIIELLEHVSSPYSLLKDAADSIISEGRIIITLAVNIPQFDHVINFDDQKLFRIKIDELGLYIEYERMIEHQYIMNGLSHSSNIFMILSKK